MTVCLAQNIREEKITKWEFLWNGKKDVPVIKDPHEINRILEFQHQNKKPNTKISSYSDCAPGSSGYWLWK